MTNVFRGRAVYAGSFDPVTHGHLSMIRRGARLFDEIIVGVGENPAKKYLFDLEERVEMIQGEIGEVSNVQVHSFQGLLISFAQEVGAGVILRGLRAVTDFEYEFQMGLANMDMDRSIETLFLLSGPENIFISSSTVKEIAYCGGPVEHYVAPAVARRLYAKFGHKIP